MNSEKQFLELVSNMVPLANDMLANENHMQPIGLTHDTEGNVETILAPSASDSDIQALVNSIQAELKEKANSPSIEATCLAYPDYDNAQVVCLLENRQNYCAKYLVPVNIDSTPVLIANEIDIEDSFVYIFPLIENGA